MSKTKISQITDTIVMVSPDQFGFNPETAATNIFQHKSSQPEEHIRDIAMNEFQDMVRKLKSENIQLLILPSRTDVITPDAVFPNNWFSHHQGNLLVLYPMRAMNRRAERQTDTLLHVLKSKKIKKPKIIDLSHLEYEGKYLEGTGSLVLDRVKKIAFAMESPRTTKEALDIWSRKMGYSSIFFHAYDKTSLPIYHTNVVMSIGDDFAVYCNDSIKDHDEKALLEDTLIKSGKEIIHISLKQLYSFCGNILQVKSITGERKIVLSDIACNAFTAKQKNVLQNHGTFVPVHIPTIEKISGGSARCMMAEIFPN